MGERKTFSVRLLPEIMKAARILAVEKEIALSEVLEEALKDYLKKNGSELRKSSKK